MKDQRHDLDERDLRWSAWMSAAQAGDAAAYEKLLLELLPYVRRLVRRRVGEPSEQEDVVQNVLVSLHRSRHTYRPDRPFGPWLRAVVRNASIDWMRARGRRLSREESRDMEDIAETSFERELPGANALSPELEQALASLPLSQREAVELLHIDGLSVAEAAEQIGVSRSALKVRAHRGYKALRAFLVGWNP